VTRPAAPAGPKAEALATGLVFPEGPAVLDDGRVAFVEVNASSVSLWEPGAGVRRLAYTGGGPNACALGSDGYLYVTQNRGIVGSWRAEHVQPGSIQRVSIETGAVETLVTQVDGVELRQPNDLAFGPDGRLYFTDPGYFDLDTKPDAGRIFALAPGGKGELLVELEATYSNGIAVEDDGSIVWTESYPRRVRRRRPDGTIETLPTLASEDAIPDGLAVGAGGVLYVTVLFAGGVQVLGADGADLGALNVGAINSNCTFGGTSLYITDFGTNPVAEVLEPGGVLWRVELDAPGQTPFRGSLG
jgi:gluconolactonase